MKTAIEQMMVDLEESLFGDSKLSTKKIWDKALEAEKQQIIEAYEIGDKYKTEISGEQYYNEKFKK
jgi:hypothetical protein